jgi:Ni,Fe-hydrogenase I large subunit
MSIEGALSLTVHWDGAAIVDARVRSGRAVHASRALEGRSCGEALGDVQRLFAVCRRSQAAAAQLACEYAMHDTASDTLLARGELEALSEYALESIWRLLLDAPPLVGDAPREAELARIRTRLMPLAREASWFALADALEEALVSSVYGIPLASWRFMACREWLRMAHPVPRLVSRLLEQPARDAALHTLPWIDSRALATEIADSIAGDAAYGETPLWRGAPAETGSLARNVDHAKVREVSAHPVAARVVARLVELAAIPGRMRGVAAGDPPRWVRGVQRSPGRGLSAVETARGTLIHAVELDEGRVASWRIVAPTEWNFHPEGAFVKGLRGTPASSESGARAAAERLAFALDPCVASEVEVAHA